MADFDLSIFIEATVVLLEDRLWLLYGLYFAQLI